MTDTAAVLQGVNRTIAFIKAAARDKREPDRKRKLKFEARLYAILRRHWRRQADRIEAYLQTTPQAGKADPTWIDLETLWEDDDFEGELVVLLRNATRSGIDLFSARALVGIDYTGVNASAAEAARTYAYDLIRKINDTTREAVREAVSAFIETPGMTIRDVMDALPFNDQRGQMVATTEITRAYSTGNRMAGEALVEQFPDVRVVKEWFTNNDDRVCEICGPLDGKKVGIEDEFSPDILEPPGHVGCRCWMDVHTEIQP